MEGDILLVRPLGENQEAVKVKDDLENPAERENAFGDVGGGKDGNPVDLKAGGVEDYEQVLNQSINE